eukprot:CAMPEP_0180013162 /NCGR_PEP_ID=MMETSP0984-20121128/17341_1 /TAXON_ID=483367 /ORGANISM="non described non described, Strain CCMP 2436" /LENGTH=64 /DNA_ID=CAMNT_0021935441 /DNA_START=151 /DNA_END=342 /DNA_ORIENTATION=-
MTPSERSARVTAPSGSAFEDWRSPNGAALQAIAEHAQRSRIVIEEAARTAWLADKTFAMLVWAS